MHKQLAMNIGFMIVNFGIFINSSYGGDGKLTDNGLFAATDRYVLDLGPINDTDSEFIISDLPSVEFTIGLSMPGNSKKCLPEEKQFNPIVKLSLETSDNVEVITEQAMLTDWIWSEKGLCQGAFIYRRGESKERKLSSGGFTYERVNFKSSNGWGTYFIPKNGKSYRLKLSLSEAPSNEFNLSLIAKTGGWK